MKKALTALWDFLSSRLNLSEDKADESLIVESIKKDASFKGVNLWTLIFAIIIASIGLNVNSTAVVIGAMLISPLMGPIMGIGLGVGINDFELLKKGVKNLTIAAIISIITSSIYFAVTPLHEASSELLARTNPAIWDVFIAFSGGIAGIIAITRKEKSNVIPGVAIATALMPPLCTAGFGLATGQWYYFFGALYLFFINSLFICLATFLIVKHLKFRKKEFASPEREKSVSRYILIIAILTILPSIYLAYGIVQRSIFENNAQQFVKKEFHFGKTQVVTHSYKFNDGKSSIELLLFGQHVTELQIDSLRKKMFKYHLDSTKLIIHQGFDARQNIDFSEIKASILEEVFSAEERKDTVHHELNKLEQPLPEIQKEIKLLYPEMTSYSLYRTVVTKMDSTKNDTITVFDGKFSRRPSSKERKKIGEWLKERIHADTLKTVFE
ncbi:MAG: TIGR00341 family protein [Taibaiella sp.]|nr:TIGR00341 family protein [Taibaiella sp.]